METNSSGVESASRTYYAYGTTRSSFGTLQTDRTYTGQKQDGTGLHYYNARYYDSSLGVFLSPDKLVPDAGAVVDYNRFLYVRGNPLKYNDPDGHTPTGPMFDLNDWGNSSGWGKSHAIERNLPTPRERRETAEQTVAPVKDFLKERVMPMTMPFPFNVIGQFTDVTISIEFGSMMSPTGVAGRGGLSFARDSEGTLAAATNMGGGGSTPMLSPVGASISFYGTDAGGLEGNGVQFGGSVGNGIIGFSEVSLAKDSRNGKPFPGVSFGLKAARPSGIPGSIHGTATNTHIWFLENPIDEGFEFWLDIIYPCQECD